MTTDPTNKSINGTRLGRSFGHEGCAVPHEFHVNFFNLPNDDDGIIFALEYTVMFQEGWAEDLFVQLLYYVSGREYILVNIFVNDGNWQRNDETECINATEYKWSYGTNGLKTLKTTQFICSLGFNFREYLRDSGTLMVKMGIRSESGTIEQVKDEVQLWRDTTEPDNQSDTSSTIDTNLINDKCNDGHIKTVNQSLLLLLFICPCLHVYFHG